MIDFLEDLGDSIFGNRRISNFKHFAYEKGFKFKRRVNPTGLDTDIKNMEFFDGKRRKSIKGYIYKSVANLSLFTQIFDYTYTNDFGKKTTTVFTFECESLDLPKYAIKPKSSLSRLGSIFSSSEWSDLDAEFDKMFSIETDNLPRMQMTVTIQFAEVMKSLPGFTVEGIGYFMVLYKKNSKIDIIDMDNVYDAGLELIDIIINDYSAEIL
ncbi:MAG: hypothetical protein V3V14_05570 [Saprospiraceae bacterium]